MQAVLRVSGWAFMLGGLAFAITSLLPLPSEVPLAVLGSATAYVLGYSVWAFMVTDKRKGDLRLGRNAPRAGGSDPACAVLPVALASGPGLARWSAGHEERFRWPDRR